MLVACDTQLLLDHSPVIKFPRLQGYSHVEGYHCFTPTVTISTMYTASAEAVLA